MEKIKIEEKIKQLMQNQTYKPLTREELLDKLKLKGGQLNLFWAVLEELEKQGIVVKTRFSTYGLPERMNLVRGTLSMTQKGFGFILPENKQHEDIFIPPTELADAMNGDTVIARINAPAAGGRQAEGEIIRVLKRKNTNLVGAFSEQGQFGFVVPDDKKIMQDIFIARKNYNGAIDGQKVVVEITVWPRKQRNPEGKIVEILDNIGDKDLDVLSIIKQHEFPLTFPERVLAAAEQVSEIVQPHEKEKRRILKNRFIVTIDSDDAKDLDDAVYVEKIDENSWLLGVYIADVSYYVGENTIIDLEARDRGTSIYLVDRVLPMLPERLSNGICSLNAGEERLVMACEMKIDNAGKLLKYEIFPGVLTVTKRLSYPVVREIVEEDKVPENMPARMAGMLKEMAELSIILRKKRLRRGAIDFDFPEQKIILAEDGKPVEIKQVKRSIAESIIEEFMLAANETVAQHLADLKVPSLYRIHEDPDEEKMQALASLLATFGLQLSRFKKVSPADLQILLQKLEGRPEESLISKVMLRSLKQAAYSAENLGHFGLAANYYTHFTSPIRRYPDLIVHRLLKEAAERKLTAKRREKLERILPEIAEHSSKQERLAEVAERETKELKKVEYMLAYIGDEFEGTISGVMSYGLFIELSNGVEGLLHVSALTDDYYQYRESEYSLAGEGSGKVYRLGDPIKVEVLQVNVATRSIDFVLPGQRVASRQMVLAKLPGRNTAKNKNKTSGKPKEAQWKKKKQKNKKVKRK